MIDHLAEAQAVMNECDFFDYPSPWIGHTARILSENRDDPEADFKGFVAWMYERLEAALERAESIGFTHEDGCQCMSCDEYTAWEDTDTLQRIHIYAEQNFVAREVAEAMGWKARIKDSDVTK